MSTSIQHINSEDLELVPGNPGRTWSQEELKRFQDSYSEAVEVALKNLPKPIRFPALPFYLR